MRRVSAWDVVFWAVMVAILASVVRPGSKASGALTAMTDALAGLVGEATGYTQRES